jgi:hypothetical protein
MPSQYGPLDAFGTSTQTTYSSRNLQKNSSISLTPATTRLVAVGGKGLEDGRVVFFNLLIVRASALDVVAGTILYFDVANATVSRHTYLDIDILRKGVVGSRGAGVVTNAEYVTDGLFAVSRAFLVMSRAPWLLAWATFFCPRSAINRSVLRLA